MKIRCSVPLYPPFSLVGAWLTTHEFLIYMRDRGHDVKVQTYVPGEEGKIPATYRFDGIEVSAMAGTTIDDFLEDADVIITHLGDAQIGASYAMGRGIPSVRMVHGWVDYADAKLYGTDLAVFNSLASAEMMPWDGPSIVCHPPVFMNQYETTPGDKVTLVNFSFDKGGVTFWEIVKRMHDTQFMAVQGGYGQQVRNRAANCELVKTTPNMRDDVYRKTRILLMPSVAETWGRTAVEAMCSGIPVIASPTDGLMECLAEAGTFVHQLDSAGWAREIERLSDPSEWAVASAAAKDRAKALDPEPDLMRFAAAVEALV